ncbi:hypothetical protein D9V37_06030 [Nocardioides mangrovicus]|uniref:Uncharacterized protein n=1 Tax=Nocardioides mangrovicus TaxID=2478913 RepID=A0A3L8P2X2_9ACTN|nr:hypothetical protein [Nocardioides mangrovicus]RLV49494.1 hypothetical protein D9V37_06030 [Nocardioides mangrovicus]
MGPREDKFGIGDVAAPLAVGRPHPRCEHVWILQQAADRPRLPGILLSFRRNGRGRWEGWVVWAAPDVSVDVDEAHLQQGWVDAERIEQVLT